MTTMPETPEQQGGQGREMNKVYREILDELAGRDGEEVFFINEEADAIKWAIKRDKRCAELEAELRVAVDLLESIKDRHVHSYDESISINALYGVDEDLERARALLNGTLAMPEEES